MRRVRLVGSAVLLFGGAVMLQPHGDLFDPSHLLPFWTGAGVMGAGFALSWWLSELPWFLFWFVAVGCRMLLLPMVPGDDVWRYLWEGWIQLHGFSPFHLAPDAAALIPLRTAWWEQINHPGVTAIYPPLVQLLFRALASLGPSVLLFKTAFLAADLGVCWMLTEAFGCGRAALYAWNPLVMVSFSGGAHFDSVFLLPLVASWLLSEGRIGFRLRRPWAWSALLLGVSVAIKWVSLPLAAWPLRDALRAGRWRRAATVLLLVAAPLLLSSLFFCSSRSCPLVPTGSDFVATGRSAEWIPHWVSQAWPATFRSNAPWGMLLAGWVVLLLATVRSESRFLLAYWMGLLLLSPIIHGWYFTWLIPFGVPRGNWGVRLVSLSAFVYFVLPSAGPAWMLSDPQRLMLWLPLILGAPWNAWPPPPARSETGLER